MLYNLQLISKNDFSYKIIQEKEGYKTYYLVEFYIRKIPLKVSFSYEDSLVEELIYVVNEAYRKLNFPPPFYLLNEFLSDSFYVIYLTDQIEIDQLKKENIIYQPNSISSYFKFSFIEN